MPRSDRVVGRPTLTKTDDKVRWCGAGIIGKRLPWLKDILTRSKEELGIVDQRSKEFCRDLESRVEQYGDRTFVSVAQINWLNRIDQDLTNEGIPPST